MSVIPSALAVAAGAAVQSITGIGFALVCTPFLITLLHPREGVRTSILLSLVVNTLVLLRERKEIRIRPALPLLIPAVVVTPFLAAAVKASPENLLRIVAGALTITCAIALWRGVRSARLRGPLAAAVAGVITAAMGVVAGIGGPASAIYAVNAGWTSKMMRSTLQVVFLIMNAVALASLGLPRPHPGLFLSLAIGWVVGVLLSGHINEKRVVSGTLIVAALGGVLAVATGIRPLAG
jgi:uncharacterized membrane protein YfcA